MIKQLNVSAQNKQLLDKRTFLVDKRNIFTYKTDTNVKVIVTVKTFKRYISKNKNIFL